MAPRKAAAAPSPAPVELTEAERWTLALDTLAQRIAAVVDRERGEHDVADHRRGKVFPTSSIVERARRGAPLPAEGVLDWEALPQRLRDLHEYLPLSQLDVGILLIAAAPALDARFEQFYVVLNNDVDARGPFVSTILQLLGTTPLDEPARVRFRPDAPLQSLGMVDMGPSSRSLLSQVVTVPERVIGYLLGSDAPDASFSRAFVDFEREPVPRELLPSLDVGDEMPVILRSRAGTAAVDQARWIARDSLGVDPLLLDWTQLDLEIDGVRRVVRRLAREAALGAGFVALDARLADAEAPVAEVVAELHDLGAPAILIVDGRRSLGPWERRAVSLPLPTVAQRLGWWQLLAPDGDHSLARTATHLDPDDIAASADGGSAALMRVAGKQRRSRVQTVAPALTLADVVLEDRPAEQMRQLVNRVRFRTTVLDEWDMRPGGGRGRGVTALFAGPSGTGKSMSAEALAGELHVPLFVVDLASVVDKYIGETEKNLEEVFRIVENEDGVLLFDEADALFGKRSDVSDARDRYANIEVAYLLQRIEAFDGLAILTTNLRANLDDAFQRRLDMIVDFPEPDVTARREIWAKALTQFPECAGDAELDALATLDLTGGYIRAAVVTAAYLAASDGATLAPAYVLRGARDEWRKAGRLNFPESTFASWPSDG